jgi:signal transduction histidine kinase
MTAEPHESLPLGRVMNVLEVSDELQKIVFYADQLILNQIVLGTKKLLDAESCGIFLRTGPEELTLKADHSEKFGFREKTVQVRIHNEPGGGLTGYLAFRGEVANLYGAELENHPYRRKESPPPEHLVSGRCKSMLVIPLKDRKGRLLALLNAHNKRGLDGSAPFTRSDSVMGQFLASKIVLVLETHRLVAAFREIMRQVSSAKTSIEDVREAIRKHAGELLMADCEIELDAETSASSAAKSASSQSPERSNYLLAPLEIRGRHFGALIASAQDATGFDQQDGEILRLIAEQASAALDAVQREQHLRMTVWEASRVAAVSNEDLDRILDGARSFGFDAGLMYIADYRFRRLKVRRSFGCEGRAVMLGEFEHRFDSISFAAKVFRAGESQFSHEPWKDPDVDQAGLKAFDIGSPMVGVPMLYQGEPVGVLVCWTKRPGHEKDESDRHVLAPYAGVAGQILGKKQLERLDDLTRPLSQDLEEIIRMLASMHGAPSVTEHIPRILESLKKNHFDRVRYYQWNELTQEFVGVYSVGMEDVPFEGHCIAIADDPIARAIYEKALRSSVAELDYSLDLQAAFMRRNPKLPIAVLPLVVNRRIYGSIVADNSESSRAIDPQALAFMTQMGAIASQLIANASSREKFLVDTFHMFKSPAQSIVGFVGLAVTRREAPDREEWLRDAWEEAKRLRLLALKVPQFARSTLSRTEVCLGELIREGIHRFRPEAENNRIRLEAGVENGRSYPVVVDREAIQVVLNTLLDNALLFSSTNETIRVMIMDADRQYSVCISDQGPGVPAKRREKIFNISQSLPPPGKPPGAGVGLAIARRLIEAHGGKLVCVDPQEERGARFCFTLNKSTRPVDQEREA